MRKLSFFIFAFLCVQASYSLEPPETLKGFLEKGKEGDFIVTESMKVFTLIRIRPSDGETLVLEEISASSKNLPKEPWEEWLKKKAPGHSSWSIVEISLNDGKILECYSFSKNSLVQLSRQESLLATLLFQPLKEIPSDKQKKVGPPPAEGEADFRKPWSPPFIFEGKKVEGAKFDVRQTTWPEDGSEIGGREVTFYFDQEKKIPLPIWIEVETSHITGKIRVIDSGKGLRSPLRRSPKRTQLN